jgi:hypothetical protein
MNAITPTSYTAAAATRQGLDPIVAALTAAGIPVAVENTGGNVLVAAVYCREGVVVITADGDYFVGAYVGSTWHDGEGDDAPFTEVRTLDEMFAAVTDYVRTFGGVITNPDEVEIDVPDEDDDAPFRVVTTLDAPLVVGEFVTGSSIGYHHATGREVFRSTFDGTYVGVQQPDEDEVEEDDAEPIHLFRDGQINGVPQTSHGFPVSQVAQRQTLTITATVDTADLGAFLVDDPDLTGCVAARFDEVFGDNGAVLTTVDVTDVTVADVDAVTVTLPSAVHAFIADMLVTFDDPDTFEQMGFTDVANAARVLFGLDK